jgi:hypothetical protein
MTDEETGKVKAIKKRYNTSSDGLNISNHQSEYTITCQKSATVCGSGPWVAI